MQNKKNDGSFEPRKFGAIRQLHKNEFIETKHAMNAWLQKWLLVNAA